MSSYDRDDVAAILRQHKYKTPEAVCSCSDLVQVGLRCDPETHEQHVANVLVEAGFRKIFDGDCGLSNVSAPDDREAAEAWMRFANLAMDDSLGAFGAMKQMLTELGYRKVRP